MIRISNNTDLEETGGVLKEDKFLERFWHNNRVRVIIGGLGALCLAIGLLVSLILASRQSSKVEIISEEEELEEKKIFVDVSGAVQKPGVYQLDSKARINDVLVVAGGLAADADRDWVSKNLNLVAKVKDGTKIYIKSVEAKQTNVSSKTGEVAGITTEEEKININTASLTELEKLPGIGPVFAQRIIDYRNQNGSYSNIEDLLKVEGVGQKLFDKIKDKITLW